MDLTGITREDRSGAVRLEAKSQKPSECGLWAGTGRQDRQSSTHNRWRNRHLRTAAPVFPAHDSFSGRYTAERM